MKVQDFCSGSILFDLDVAFVDVSFHPEVNKTGSFEDSNLVVHRLDEVKILRAVVDDLHVEQIFLQDVERVVLVVLLVQVDDLEQRLDDPAFEPRVQSLQPQFRIISKLNRFSSEILKKLRKKFTDQELFSLVVKVHLSDVVLESLANVENKILLQHLINRRHRWIATVRLENQVKRTLINCSLHETEQHEHYQQASREVSARQNVLSSADKYDDHVEIRIFDVFTDDEAFDSRVLTVDDCDGDDSRAECDEQEHPNVVLERPKEFLERRQRFTERYHDDQRNAVSAIP